MRQKDALIFKLDSQIKEKNFDLESNLNLKRDMIKLLKQIQTEKMTEIHSFSLKVKNAIKMESTR